MANKTRRYTSVIRAGEPIEVGDPSDDPNATPYSSLCSAVAATLGAYLRAGRELVNGQYASVRDLAPPHLRVPCHAYVVCCRDGVLVRYDAARDQEPKVRYADHSETLAEAAPKFSEHMIHLPEDPATYVPEERGPAVSLILRGPEGEREHSRIYPWICAPRALPPEFNLPPPAARPPALASVSRELHIELRGDVEPINGPEGSIPTSTEHFIAHGMLTLPVGWQSIELYPILSEDYWRPEYVGSWAQLDLMSAVAQRNTVENALHSIDGRRAAREHYASVIGQFEALLAGAEEPCHQFLKQNAGLLCPTHDAAWSKLRFGDHISDFVFREPGNDYLLVEIEAPYREIFRRDGHPRQALQHAISQIDDWLGYLQADRARVEQELNLAGISATPRTMVVIGRSSSLTDDNRKKLAVLQSQRPDCPS